MRDLRSLLGLGLAVLLAGAGCSDENDTPLNDPGPAYPFAGSPQQLMANFEQAYEARDIDAYADLLDDGFRFILRPETVTEFGLPRTYFDRTEEEDISRSMFSGVPPCECVGAITALDFGVLNQIDDWETTENEEFPGTLETGYDVQLRAMQTATEDEMQFDIRGRVVVFVSTAQVEYQGRERTLHQLAGIIDQTTTSSKGTEDVSWGSLKALYRPANPAR